MEGSSKTVNCVVCVCEGGEYKCSFDLSACGSREYTARERQSGGEQAEGEQTHGQKPYAAGQLMDKQKEERELSLQDLSEELEQLSRRKLDTAVRKEKEISTMQWNREELSTTVKDELSLVEELSKQALERSKEQPSNKFPQTRELSVKEQTHKQELAVAERLSKQQLSVRAEKCKEGAHKTAGCETCWCLMGEHRCVFDKFLCHQVHETELGHWITNRMILQAHTTPGSKMGEEEKRMLGLEVEKVLEDKGLAVLSVRTTFVDEQKSEAQIEVEYREKPKTIVL